MREGGYQGRLWPTGVPWAEECGCELASAGGHGVAIVWTCRRHRLLPLALAVFGKVLV